MTKNVNSDQVAGDRRRRRRSLRHGGFIRTAAVTTFALSLTMVVAFQASIPGSRTFSAAMTERPAGLWKPTRSTTRMHVMTDPDTQLLDTLTYRDNRGDEIEKMYRSSEDDQHLPHTDAEQKRERPSHRTQFNSRDSLRRLENAEALHRLLTVVQRRRVGLAPCQVSLPTATTKRLIEMAFD